MKAFFRYFYLLLAALSLFGCRVDPDYDFSKLNTTVTVLKGVEFPVPDTQILLKDVIRLEDYDYITCDDRGNYLIDFHLEPVHMPVFIPESDSDRISVDLENVEYSFGTVPDFLSGKDQTVVVDLSDMKVSMGIDSDIPAEFTFGMAIEAIRSGAVSKRCSIDGLTVRNGSNRYVFLENKTPTDPDYYQAVPELGQLLSPIPDAVRIGSVEVYADAEQRALVAHDQLYNLSCEVSATSPIRFSEGTHIRMSTPLNAQLDLDQIGLKKAILSVSIENSMPLDCAFNLYACDAAGNQLESIQVTPDFEKIPALGRTGGAVTLTSSGDLRFSSLLFELTASAPASLASTEYYGTNLNRNQGLNLTHMSLYLPDGIQIRLASRAGNE